MPEEPCPWARAFGGHPPHRVGARAVTALRCPGTGAQRRELAFLREGGARPLEEVEFRLSGEGRMDLTKGNREEEHAGGGHSRSKARCGRQPSLNHSMSALATGTVGRDGREACHVGSQE